MVERPIKAATNANKNELSSNETKFEKWNKSGAYNPKYVAMMIEILRVYNNYILTDEKKIKNKKNCNKQPKTPAQKLGLVDKVFDI
jgi:hypothetical protein